MDKYKSYFEILYLKKFLPELKRIYKKEKLIPDYGEIFNNEVLDILEQPDGSLGALSEYLDKLVVELKTNHINKVLVLGAGSGRMGNFIRNKFPKSVLYELDLNRLVVERLKKKFFNDPLRFIIQGNIERMPIRSDFFDIAIGYGVLRYIKNKKQAVEEINRVIKKNGGGIVGEGRTEEIIDEMSQVLNHKQIPFRKEVYKNALLPRITFFYYLLNKSKVDKNLKKVIGVYAAKYKKNLVEACFDLAGASKDKVYFLSWKKF